MTESAPVLPAFSMNCRSGCGACCIAISISSAIPGMPDGKAAGERCAQLGDDNGCLIFTDPRRPAICARLTPGLEMCGETREYALQFLGELERCTAPD